MAENSIVVRRGDTLASIAKRYGTTVDEIAKQNNLQNVNSIQIGMELSISTKKSNQTAGLTVEKNERTQPKHVGTPKTYDYDSDREKSLRKQSSALAGQLYEQISGPSRNEKTIALLKKISPDNVIYVLEEYSKLTNGKESLAQAIDNEWGLDEKTVKQYICSNLVGFCKKYGINGIFHSSYMKLSNIEDVEKFIENAHGKILKTLNIHPKRDEEKINQSSTLGKFENRGAKLAQSFNSNDAKEVSQILYDQIKGASNHLKTANYLNGYIDKYNVVEILSEYSKLTGGKESLARAVDNEFMLDYKDVKKYIGSRLFQYAKNNNIDVRQFVKEYNNADNIDSLESVINKMHKYLKSKQLSGFKLDHNILRNFGSQLKEDNEQFKKYAGIDLDYAILLSDEFTDEEKIGALKESFEKRRREENVDYSSIETQFYKDLAHLRETKDYINFYEIYKSTVDKLESRSWRSDDAVEYNLNGKIDKDFEQGNTGDCWLLASIKLLANDPKGLKILNDSIQVDKNGDAIVTLQGVNKTYKISRKEIENSRELSTGDSDVRAIEIAVNRYLHDTYRQTGEGDASIDGGFEYRAYEILTGQDGRSFFEKFLNVSPLRGIDEDTLDTIKKSNILACVSSSGTNNSKQEFTATDIKSGEKVELHKNHAYTVSKVTDKEVYLINPWDTSSTIKLTIQEFRNFFTRVQYLDANDL